MKNINTFKEANLPSDFANEKYADIQQFLDSSLTFTIVGMPSVGVSLFLKFLACRKKDIIYIDTYSIIDATKHGFYLIFAKSLGADVDEKMSDGIILQKATDALENLVSKQRKVLIIINRFELLEKEFTQQFLGSLRLFPHKFGNAVSYIFSLTRPFEQIDIESLGGGNLDLFTNYYFFKPYSAMDLKNLLKIHNPDLSTAKKNFEKALTLSGGHFQLFQLLLKIEKGGVDPLRDPFINLLLKHIYENLAWEQRKQIQKIALGKNRQVDSYLNRIGLLNIKNNFFSPLFKEYIVSQIRPKLPAKEARLFKLLKKSKGKIVPKEIIFTELWENSSEASDWALDSLIYRLRRNPVFVKSGYMLESYKKQGYLLRKS